MNADKLLAHFEKISDAPNAVERLRRFVLDLAVRGKLVEQNPKEGTADEWLALPERSTKQAMTAKGVRSSFEDGERWCSIPVSWTFVRLGEIATVVMGSSPPGSSYNRDGDGVPLINGPVEFSSGAFGRTVINQHTTAPTAFCEEGDFLICVRGSTTGRTNVAGCRACIGRGVAAIQCHFPDAYIRHAVCLQRDKILAMGRGIAFPSISRDQLLNLAIPLPPLAEQHRIVEKVDELMLLCDRLEASQAERETRRDRLVVSSLNRLGNPSGSEPEEFKKDAGFHLRNLNRLSTKPEHIKELRKAILNLAVRGKLMPQDEGSSLTVDPDTDSTDPDRRLEMLLPQGWRWVQVKDVANSRLGKMLDKAKNRGRPFRYLRNTNVHWFTIHLDDIKTMPLTVEESSDFVLAPGDVLICEGGHGIARTAVWRGAEKEMAFQKALHRVRPGEVLIGDFLAFCIRVYFDEGILQRLFTGVGIPHFTGVALAKLTFPLPPLSEQKRIVAKVDELMAICDQLERQLESQQKESRRLLEALLHEALEGAG